MNFINSIKNAIEGERRMKRKALVVLSGGQDSTTCLFLAEMMHYNVEAIHFTYGQRHSVETCYVKRFCDKRNIALKVVDVSFLKGLVSSNLLNTEGDINEPHVNNKSLPSSFVPVRNALFLTIAHGYAQEICATDIYTGLCETDYSGYPDCRQEFVRDLSVALDTGYSTAINIHTPLMYLTKAETFKIADDYSFLHEILTETITCYNGNATLYNEWGHGCGRCPACLLRKKGFEEYKEGLAGVYND